jgi:enamine deaminase RidA (YjgF/YER057c/UK114 family)
MAAIVPQPIQNDAPSWPAGSPASPAVRMGDLLFTSGQIAVDADFQPLYPGDVAAQTRHAFDNIRALFDATGGSMHDVLELMVLVRDPRDLPAIYDVARD